MHARLLLEHLAGTDAALQTMTQAVRPGGWLFIEAADPLLQPLACPDETGPAQALANRLLKATWKLQAKRTDLGYGRSLPRRLRSAGLLNVAAEVGFALAGPAPARLQRTMIERVRERLITAGLATQDELDRHLADIAAGWLDLAAFPVVSAWGRKPAERARPARHELHRDRRTAVSFGADPERYDRTPPSNPNALIERIVPACPGGDVLDVGCGTGMAARQFQAAGCRVLGVQVLDAVGAAIDDLGGSFTMPYTTVTVTAAANQRNLTFWFSWPAGCG